MRISVPTEVKNNEYRVALTPAGVHDLALAGHEVFVQRGAGEGSSMPDAEYDAAGAILLDDAAEVWARAELLLKVKEPIASEYGYFRDDLVLFTYLHLAADRPLTDRLVADRRHRHRLRDGPARRRGLPLLAPMSEVAGRLAPTVGAATLMRSAGGLGSAHVGRARHPSGAGHGHRRRRRRSERGGDRRRPRRRRHGVRHERAAPALPRRSLPGPRQDRGIQPPRSRPRGRRLRPGHRLGSDPGREGAEARHERHGRADEARQRAGRHRRRPGRLLRGHPADDARRSRRSPCTAASSTAWRTCPVPCRTPPPRPSRTRRCPTSARSRGVGGRTRCGRMRRSPPD